MQSAYHSTVSQHRDCGDEGVQWSAACGTRWSDVSLVSSWPDRATFDTVDNELLLLRLERQFGWRGIVLAWFLSYLFGRTFRHSVWCLAAERRPSSTSFAQSIKGQCWVRCCSLCTQQTLQLLRRSTVCLYTRSPMTRNCIFTVVVSTRRQLLPNWNVALLM